MFEQAVIMGSYYAAQLGIALSVINSHKAVVRVEMESEVIDIDGYPSHSSSFGKNTRPGSVGWKNSPTAFDTDEDELPFPNTRFPSK